MTHPGCQGPNWGLRYSNFFRFLARGFLCVIVLRTTSCSWIKALWNRVQPFTFLLFKSKFSVLTWWFGTNWRNVFIIASLKCIFWFHYLGFELFVLWNMVQKVLIWIQKFFIKNVGHNKAAHYIFNLTTSTKITWMLYLKIQQVTFDQTPFRPWQPGLIMGG